MRLDDPIVLQGYEPTERAQAIYFSEPGKAVLGEALTGLDIIKYSLNNNGDFFVGLMPIGVGFCLSDTEGGSGRFPHGSTRFENSDPNKSPAIPGHENVAQVVVVPENAIDKLSERGIELGSIVSMDANIGCNACESCVQYEHPAILCEKGTAFAGIGNFPMADAWVKENTGRPHIPGLYTKGVVAAPIRSLHKIPDKITSIEDMMLYTMSDSLACAYATLFAIGIPVFKNPQEKDSLYHPSVLYKLEHGYNNPRVLIIGGAGRLGGLHVAALKDVLPDAEIFIADINKRNLDTIKHTFEIPEDHMYKVNPNRPDSYSRKMVMAKLNNIGSGFHYIIDTTGGKLSPEIVGDIISGNGILVKGGKFCTTALDIPNISIGTYQTQGVIHFVSSLSPQAYIPNAIGHITRESGMFHKIMGKSSDGLTQELADRIANGGDEFMAKSKYTSFYTIVNKPFNFS